MDFTGSILSCFLPVGHDGGPCEAAIKLQPEKFTINNLPEETVSPSIKLDDEEEPRGLTKIQKKLSPSFSANGYNLNEFPLTGISHDPVC